MRSAHLNRDAIHHYRKAFIKSTLFIYSRLCKFNLNALCSIGIKIESKKYYVNDKRLKVKLNVLYVVYGLNVGRIVW